MAGRFEWRVSARAVEEDEAAYGLNATRARPVSMVQVRHGCLGCCHARERRHSASVCRERGVDKFGGRKPASSSAAVHVHVCHMHMCMCMHMLHMYVM